MDGFLEKLRALTPREGTVLIFDEMISGVRFDLRGAHHRWGVYPGPGLFRQGHGNGFSFSLLAGRRDDHGPGRHSARGAAGVPPLPDPQLRDRWARCMSRHPWTSASAWT